MFGRRKNKSAIAATPAQPGVRMMWYRPPQAHVDTVVFVHGVLGHYVRTWGQFPRLLCEDDDLPQLDILLWGYHTGWFARHHELHMEGGHLATTLQALVRPEPVEPALDLERVVRKLDPQDRQVLQWARDGVSISEIARKLGVSYTAAGVRLHRLKKRLHAALR